MKRVTGIGGVFIKCEDPNKAKAWYDKHLGIPAGDYGHTFKWRHWDAPETEGTTAWSTFKKESTYFGDSGQPYMINYRVENLVALLEALKAEGVEVMGEMQEFEYGKFAWIKDLDGNRIELWEPVDQVILDMEAGA